MELDATPFALRDSLGATVKALGLRAHEKGLELICHIAPGVPDSLIGDSLRLRQIVTNLVGNAIKFTASGEVAMHVLVENESADFVGLHVAVRDTGIGILASKQQDDLRGLHAGRHIDDPQLRRHRLGFGDHVAIGRADGRPRLGGKASSAREARFISPPASRNTQGPRRNS